MSLSLTYELMRLHTNTCLDSWVRRMAQTTGRQPGAAHRPLARGMKRPSSTALRQGRSPPEYNFGKRMTGSLRPSNGRRERMPAGSAPTAGRRDRPPGRPESAGQAPGHHLLWSECPTVPGAGSDQSAQRPTCARQVCFQLALRPVRPVLRPPCRKCIHYHVQASVHAALAGPCASWMSPPGTVQD